MSDSQPDPRLDDLNQTIGRMLDERATDHELYTREREILSAMIVEAERHAQSLLAVIERAKSRIAGISPSGGPPPAG